MGVILAVPVPVGVRVDVPVGVRVLVGVCVPVGVGVSLALGSGADSVFPISNLSICYYPGSCIIGYTLSRC